VSYTIKMIPTLDASLAPSLADPNDRRIE